MTPSLESRPGFYELSVGRLQIMGGAVDARNVNLKSRPGFLAVAIAAAIAAAGAAVVVQGAQMGVIGLHGARLMGLLIGIAICAAGIFMFQRGVRRRARFEAIRALLPRNYGRRYAWAIATRETDSDWGDDSLEHLPLARAEIHAATRALLVSLEDEMGCEPSRARRSGRPACRRARLRVAGRSESRRRRIAPRPATTPS